MRDDAVGPPAGFRSLTARLITWILLSCGGVYVVSLTVTHARARRMAVEAAEREADKQAEAATNRVQEVLRSIEEGTRLLSVTLETVQPTEAGLGKLVRGFVAGNPNIYGSAAAFAPRAFQPGRERYAVYFHCDVAASDPIVSVDLSSDSDRYWEREWYREAARTGRARWSEPYLDQGGGGVWTVTHSVPFFRAENGGRELRGVVTADLHLDWLNRIVETVHIGRTGFGVVLSRTGQVLAHPDPAMIGASAAELGRVDPERQRQVGPIVEQMLAGRSGFLPVEAAGRRYRLTYAPLSSAGWSLAVLYPEDELLEGVRRLRLLQLALVAFGLAVLAGVVILLSRRLARPLQALAGSAGRIATGDLDAALPAVTSRDEIGALTASFHHMRDSLKTHIRDLQETTAARERLESELKVARRIQMDMLPKESAGGPGQGFELWATLVPARAVGGDLYDHFQQGSRVFFLVGDVSGKGIPAALFMARAKMLFETVAPREADPGAILREVNRGLCAENDAGMFVTVVCGTLATDSGDLVFSCGGHDAPVLLRAGRAPESLKTEGGPILGLLDVPAYPVDRLRLAPGDALVLFSDGVPEAFNEADELFSHERLLATLGPVQRDRPKAITDAVLEAVRAFAGQARQSDDITILTLRYAPPHA